MVLPTPDNGPGCAQSDPCEAGKIQLPCARKKPQTCGFCTYPKIPLPAPAAAAAAAAAAVEY